MLGKDAFRFLMLPVAKVQIVLKKFFLYRHFKGKILNITFFILGQGKI